jgi:hypothetical protein
MLTKDAGNMPMTTKGDMEVAKKAMLVCRLARIDKLLFSIIVRVCFMYDSYLV